MEIDRRSFLGGMLTLLGVSTFTPPALALVGNSTPRIFGNGRDYDAEGFQALFNGQDVIIPQDKIGISKCKGVIFHKGTFVIEREVYTQGHELTLDGNPTFDGRLLKWWEAFFTTEREFEQVARSHSATWLRSEGHISLDCAGRVFGINHKHIADQTRTQPPKPKEI